MPQIDKTILELISTQKIGEQEELCRYLNEHDCKITQSTLSRRLKKLGIIKHQGFYKQISSFIAEPSKPKVVTCIVVSAPNLIVVRTTPAQANGFAAKLDEAVELVHSGHKIKGSQIPESFKMILGTVAGDDTLFIATALDADLKALQRDLECFDT